MRVLIERNGYRVIEVPDYDYNIDSLKGDMFNPEVAGIPVDELRLQEQEFEQEVSGKGVFGYVLERWNPAVGVGWTHVESCWGFIGPHSDEEHYIVAEFERLIPGGNGE